MQWMLHLGGGFTLFVAFLLVVLLQQFEAFAKVIVPILATYIAVAALMYNRGRALRKGPSKVRSLYAAERAVQAALFTVVGAAIGAVIFGWAYWFGLSVQKDGGAKNAWVLIYSLPLLYIMAGYTSFLLGLRVIAKEFLRPLSAKEAARRLRGAP
ncbi:hypothetical protein [Ramlibacter sp.]|uniref:hypothetical protein n=1 Tax=Ramlibacter sp. TaxID=1917967 RepID=UPI002C35C593|nr:hypothetical protein [Ramlibacter sp.]HWI83642.1 hypothetical protein [Ramlibacter sp.]